MGTPCYTNQNIFFACYRGPKIRCTFENKLNKHYFLQSVVKEHAKYYLSIQIEEKNQRIYSNPPFVSLASGDLLLSSSFELSAAVTPAGGGGGGINA